MFRARPFESDSKCSLSTVAYNNSHQHNISIQNVAFDNSNQLNNNYPQKVFTQLAHHAYA
jgi:hypothetical protein